MWGAFIKVDLRCIETTTPFLASAIAWTRFLGVIQIQNTHLIVFAQCPPQLESSVCHRSTAGCRSAASARDIGIAETARIEAIIERPKSRHLFFFMFLFFSM